MKRFTTLLVVLALLVLATTGAFAQTISATTYPFVASSGASLEDMSSGTTQLIGPGVDDGGGIGLTNIGFEFFYVGTRYTSFTASANGFVRLGATLAGSDWVNTYGAGATQLPNIAPYWDDLWVGTDGKVHYKVIDSAPNRKLVIEWVNSNIPRGGAATAGGGVFQVKLHESTGVVEMTYGNGIAVNSANGGYSIGLSSAAAVFASVTTTGETVSYAAANNTQTNAIAAGTKFSFTPLVPNDPTWLAPTAVSALGMTLNWSDLSSNEVGFAIYRSTDGINYTFINQVGADVVTSVQSGLAPSTTYFWRVYAVTEGALSASPASGSQITSAPGVIVSTGSGNWSSTTPDAPWPGGIVPTLGDNVTIADGHTVIVDAAAACLNLTVGQGATGVLEFNVTTGVTLAVGIDVTVAVGGTLQTGATGAIATHVLSLGGNLTNNGTLDLSTFAGAVGATLTFNGVNNSNFTGTGAVTDLRVLSLAKSSISQVVELNLSNFSVRDLSAAATGALLTSGAGTGTLKISGTNTFSGTLWSATGYTIPATLGIWMNNPNFTVNGQNGSPTVAGQFRMSDGTYNIGTSTGNSMGFSSGSVITVEGGAINATGRFGVNGAANAFSYTQTGGTITVQTIGNASGTLAGFDLGTSTGSSITMTNGTVIIQLANTNATPFRDVRIQSGNGIGITGGTLQFGNASSGAAKAYTAAGIMPNVIVTNTSGNHSVTMGLVATYFSSALTLTINTGTAFNNTPATNGQFFMNGNITNDGTLNIGNYLFIMTGGTLTNNGVLTGTGASSRLYFQGPSVFARGDDGSSFVDPEFNQAISFSAEKGGLLVARGGMDDLGRNSVAQTYTGTGTVTAPLSSFDIDNPLGVTIDPAVANIIVARVIIFTGGITNSDKLTLGNGAATTGTIQFGNTTTPTNAGNFDVAPVFNLGTGGQVISYLRTGAARTTGVEINPTRILTTMTQNDTGAGHNLTIAGGNLRTATLNLTAGKVMTDASNTLIVTGATPPNGSATSFVDGPLGIDVNSATNVNRTFAIGKGSSWRPLVLGAFHSGGVLQTYTAEAINGATGGTANAPLQGLNTARYFRLQNTTNVASTTTATVQLSYGGDDVTGGLASARIGQAATAAGAYDSRGGATAVAPTTGIVSNTAINAGDDFFVIANEASLPSPAVIGSPADAATGVAVTATLNWTDGGGSTGYKLFFGTDGGGVTPPTTHENGTDLLNVLTYDPPGNLAFSTLYYWQVVAYNGSGDAVGSAIWSFTTAADPLISSFPFVETFEDASPSRPNWGQIMELGAGSWTYAAGSSGGLITTAFAGVKNARFVSTSPSGGGTPVTKLVSPPMDLTSLTAPRVVFRYGQEVWFGDQNETKVYYRISGSDPWVEIAHYTGDVSAWTQEIVTLPAPSATYQIAFEGINNFGRANVVDEVTVEETPAGAPAAATLVSPADAAINTATSLSLNWVSGGGAAETGYRINFGTDGGGVTPPTTIENNTDLTLVTTYAASGLAYSTTYYWQITAYNGSGDAPGSVIRSFTTGPDPTVTTFPHAENFDGVTAPAIPYGWTIENTNADAFTWFNQTSVPRSAANAMRINWNSSIAMDDWLFSPPLSLTGSTTYRVKFWYRTGGGFPENLEVKWGSTASSAGMTEGPIANIVGAVNTAYTEVVADFTPSVFSRGTRSADQPSQKTWRVDQTRGVDSNPLVKSDEKELRDDPSRPMTSGYITATIRTDAAGIYHVGLHGYSTPDQFSIFIDDFSVDEVPPPPANFPPAISYDMISSTINGAAIVLTATISDDFGVDSSVAGGPRLWYRSASAIPLAGAYTDVSGARTSPGADTWDFALPALPSGTFVEYYVAAQDADTAVTEPAGTPNTMTPPNGTVTAPNRFAVKSPLDFTVGTVGADFPSITEGLTWFFGGIDGSMQFLLNSDYTSVGEVYPIIIGGIPGLGSFAEAVDASRRSAKPRSGSVQTRGASGEVAEIVMTQEVVDARARMSDLAFRVPRIKGLGQATSGADAMGVNTFTIKPNTAATPGPIAGSESSIGLIWLTSASHVTFQDLSIRNSGSMGAFALSDGSNDNKFIGCEVKANVTAGNAVGNFWFVDNVVLDGNARNTIDDCDLTHNGAATYNGITYFDFDGSVDDTVRNSRIFDWGTTLGSGNGMWVIYATTGLVVEGNEFYTTTPSAIGPSGSLVGILLGAGGGANPPVTASTVRGNEFHDMNASTSLGLLAGVATGFTGAVNGTGFLIEGNTVRDLGATTALVAGGSVRGISLAVSDLATVSKNHVRNLQTVTPAGIVTGIRHFGAAASGFHKHTIVNNFVTLGVVGGGDTDYRAIWDAGAVDDTVVVAFNSVYVGGVAATGNSNAYVRTTTSNTTLRNNILMNQRTDGTGFHYAIRSTPVSGGTFNSDYNDLYADGPVGGTLGAWAGVDQPGLAAWQAASAGDANSVDGDPLYVDPLLADLHINTGGPVSPTSNAGIAFGGVTDDIDSEAGNRSTTPDIGADEFSLFVAAPAFTASASSINFGNVDSGATKQDSLYVKNTGTATLNILSATSDDVEFVVAPPSAIIAAGDSAWFHVTYGPTAVEADAGNIVFGHDAASSPDTVTVSGNGVVPGASPKFLSVSPDTIIAKDPVKLKFLKPVKRAKPGKPITMPNWANLLDETVAQGGFGPGASTGDSAGGMVIGESFMFKKNPADPLKPKWSPVKESANLFAWVRLTKWDFKKNLGKGYNALQKTLENKTFNHMVDAATHRPRGFDSTLSPGMPKRKQMKKQATKLDSKKTPNNLFAELVALKVNIAASQMEKTPAGFGELIFDVDTSAFDEMEVKAISEKADSMMTHWQSFTPVDSAGANYSQYDDLYNAAYAINRAFVGVLDTASFMQTDTTFILGKLRLEGQVSIDDVPYMKLPVLFRPVTIAATTWEVESGEEEDFLDEEWENETGVPVAAKLYQNYPNPFNPSTKISFQLLETSQVTVKIFNMLGQEVASLFSNEEFEEGYNTVQFDATGLASGVYFYQIQAQGIDDAGLRTIATQKMVLLK